MDRNYFLSYGHKITLLLLLAAVGKLNTKLISVMRTKPELSYCTDIKNHLQGYFADVSVHLCSETKNDGSVSENLSAHQKQTHIFYGEDSQYKLPIFNTIKLVALSNKWNYSCQQYRENVCPIFKDVKKFYSNSIKLVDGFKFIIKIPDKPILSLIL
ncbi:hypothetical protein [Chryseobacterium sp. T20]|uniref:hypothetical protein n=1 Tax=Chryseobacterium sp. T20 TaxID=3395375 RepID=UPI0039BC824A